MKAVELGISKKKKWKEDIEHHPNSKRIMAFISSLDFHEYGRYFGWRTSAVG
jgi:hypothetical protein